MFSSGVVLLAGKSQVSKNLWLHLQSQVAQLVANSIEPGSTIASDQGLCFEDDSSEQSDDSGMADLIGS